MPSFANPATYERSILILNLSISFARCATHTLSFTCLLACSRKESIRVSIHVRRRLDGEQKPNVLTYQIHSIHVQLNHYNIERYVCRFIHVFAEFYRKDREDQTQGWQRRQAALAVCKWRRTRVLPTSIVAVRSVLIAVSQ